MNSGNNLLHGQLKLAAAPWRDQVFYFNQSLCLVDCEVPRNRRFQMDVIYQQSMNCGIIVIK